MACAGQPGLTLPCALSSLPVPPYYLGSGQGSRPCRRAWAGEGRAAWAPSAHLPRGGNTYCCFSYPTGRLPFRRLLFVGAHRWVGLCKGLTLGAEQPGHLDPDPNHQQPALYPQGLFFPDHHGNGVTHQCGCQRPGRNGWKGGQEGRALAKSFPPQCRPSAATPPRPWGADILPRGHRGGAPSVPVSVRPTEHVWVFSHFCLPPNSGSVQPLFLQIFFPAPPSSASPPGNWYNR